MNTNSTYSLAYVELGTFPSGNDLSVWLQLVVATLLADVILVPEYQDVAYHKSNLNAKTDTYILMPMELFLAVQKGRESRSDLHGCFMGLEG